MATKEQVLPLLNLGLTPQQIAKKLKCCSGYVRAVKARVYGRGLETMRAYEEKRKTGPRSEEFKKRRRVYDRQRRLTNPAYLEASRNRSRAWRARRKAEQSQSAN